MPFISKLGFFFPLVRKERARQVIASYLCHPQSASPPLLCRADTRMPAHTLLTTAQFSSFQHNSSSWGKDFPGIGSSSLSVRTEKQTHTVMLVWNRLQGYLEAGVFQSSTCTFLQTDSKANKGNDTLAIQC